MDKLRIGIGLAGLIAAAGCNAIVGIREGTLVEDTGAACGQGGAAQGSQAGSGTFPSSSASSSTGMAIEDCLDGQDNDGDGYIDCEDAACQAGFECTDEAPAGWTDYVRVHTTPYGMSTGITCPDNSAPLHYFEGPGGPVQCSMCQCSLTGASCGAPQISCHFGSLNCMGPVDLTLQASSTTCIGDPNASGADPASCRLTANAAVLLPGTCSSSGGTVTSIAPPWAQDVLLCGGPAAGAGCAAGQVCVPKGTGNFAGSVCIARAGSDMCPAGWNTRIETYTDGTDSRTCSACGCSAECTGGSYIAHDQDNCAPPGMFDTPNISISSTTCISVGTSFGGNSASLTPMLATPGPACSGGTPTGQVDTQDPHVICCP